MSANKEIINVISMSGGKDSTALACLALETRPRESLRFVFADTGNEHELTYEYLGYLERTLQIKITWLRAEFSRQIAVKRQYIEKRWPLKNVPDSAVERATKAMVATGNPYLDLCLWKGMFPSRKKQFCTQFLKTEPMVEYQMDLCDQGFVVWSWQGVRRDESQNRRYAKEFEEVGGGLFHYRPIVRWTAQDAFDAHACYGLEPNPLYKLGMTRVGCMPCINASKDELLEISKRFPGHIDRIAMWEIEVRNASKRQEASFFPNPDRESHLDKRGIHKMVLWARTARGGRQTDFVRDDEPAQCSSSYGLCE